MDFIKFFAACLVGGYVALYVLFYVVWGVSYVIHAMAVTLYAWIGNETITAEDLRVNYIKYAKSRFWRPFMTIPLILWGVLFVVFVTIESFFKVFMLRILPVLRKWKKTFRMNYKFWPTWGNNDTLASFLNRLIGAK